MMKFAIMVVLISLVQNRYRAEIFPEASLDIDYSGLADEAETHKNDILKFLNESHVKQRYKLFYDSLLSKLLTGHANNSINLSDNSPPFDTIFSNATLRRGSTRRIVSGRNTSIAAVPWQVSLREKTYPICGGSVVTHVWVLSAAHCLLRARASDLSVRLGSSWKTHGGEMYDIKNSFVHPKYMSKTKSNDVGLVELYSPLRFSARILPIMVVNKEVRLKANKPAIVSGWGKLKEGGPSATYLQSTSIKTIAMKLCKRSGLDRKAIDPSTMFCAGSFKQPSPDACQGDSGGPIVSDGILIGVVSWGLGCARGNFPGVYTRLAYPVVWDWVHQYITKIPDESTTA